MSRPARAGLPGRAGRSGFAATASRARHYLLLAAVTAGWGTIPVLAGWSGLPSGLIVAFRLWTAALCLGAVLLVEHRLGPDRPTGQWPKLFSVKPVACCLAAVVLGAHWLALFAAYQRAPAGTVILIVYLAPVGVAAAAPRLLGERVGRRTVMVLATALVGFVLLSAPAVGSARAGGLVLSVVASALFVVLILLSKTLAPAYGGLRLAFIELAGAGILVIPVALTSHWPAFQAGWLWVVVLGVVHTAAGITLYLSVLADLPATHVGILSYLEPVVVVLAAWIWLGQRPGVGTAVGGALVVVAGLALAAVGLESATAGGPAVAPSDPAIPSP